MENNVFDLDWDSGLKIFNSSLEEKAKMIKSLSDKGF